VHGPYVQWKFVQLKVKIMLLIYPSSTEVWKTSLKYYYVIIVIIIFIIFFIYLENYYISYIHTVLHSRI